MNKKLIAVAVASAFVLPMAAQAELTPYAQVQFELTDFDRDGSTNDNMAVTDNQRGRLGVKGEHDLGGGLKSFAIAEFDFVGTNNDVEFGGNTNHAFRVREVNAGLSGGFGSIGVGTVKSAYKYLGGVKYDPFVATQLEQRGRGGMSSGVTGHNGFLNNAFVYTGKFGMAKIHATYSLDDTDRDTGTANDDDGEFSVGVSFGNKMWEAGIAAFDEGVSVAADSTEAVKVFGKVSFAGMHTILAQFEAVDESPTADSDYIMVSYQLKLGKGMVVATYGERDSNNNANDSDNVTVAYKHKFNKQTSVWAGYQTYDQTGTASDVDYLSVGVRVDI